jgi:hypothetical protein
MKQIGALFPRLFLERIYKLGWNAPWETLFGLFQNLSSSGFV